MGKLRVIPGDSEPLSLGGPLVFNLILALVSVLLFCFFLPWWLIFLKAFVVIALFAALGFVQARFGEPFVETLVWFPLAALSTPHPAPNRSDEVMSLLSGLLFAKFAGEKLGQFTRQTFLGDLHECWRFNRRFGLNHREPLEDGERSGLCLPDLLCKYLVRTLGGFSGEPCEEVRAAIPHIVLPWNGPIAYRVCVEVRFDLLDLERVSPDVWLKFIPKVGVFPFRFF